MMANWGRKLLCLLFLAGCLLLTACTGGGDDGDDAARVDYDPNAVPPEQVEQILRMREQNTDPPPAHPDGTRG